MGLEIRDWHLSYHDSDKTEINLSTIYTYYKNLTFSNPILHLHLTFSCQAVNHRIPFSTHTLFFIWVWNTFVTFVWTFYNCLFFHRVINTENSAVRNSIKDVTLYRIYIYDLTAFVFLFFANTGVGIGKF